jgi:hypothetical protein
MQIEPFTYYKSSDNQRAFLVADVDDPKTNFFSPPEGRVVLIEWGKTRREPVYHNLAAFVALVEEGKLILFTPSLG